MSETFSIAALLYYRRAIFSVSLSKEGISSMVPICNSSVVRSLYMESVSAQRRAHALATIGNSSTEATWKIIEESAVGFLSCGPERSVQRSVGTAVTEAGFVGFIDSDMDLPLGVVDGGVGVRWSMQRWWLSQTGS